MSSPVASSESLVTPSVPSWSKSPSSPIDHGKFAENINDLSVQVKKAIDEKNTRTSEMVSVVNQIKAVEVDLDRQAQLVNELSERVKRGEIQYSVCKRTLFHFSKIHNFSMFSESCDA